MAFWRGFKSAAHAISLEVRDELGLSPLDRLDPVALAAHLAIPVIPLSQLRAVGVEAAGYFMDVDEGAFSAVTVFHGSKRVIVYNDAHAPGRQASDVAHELAHALLHHSPAPAFGDGGCRDWNEDLEDEANFLGGALLVTEAAALDVVRRGVSEREAARAYGVTPTLMRWRINVTGARKRVERSHNWQRTRR